MSDEIRVYLRDGDEVIAATNESIRSYRHGDTMPRDAKIMSMRLAPPKVMPTQVVQHKWPVATTMFWVGICSILYVHWNGVGLVCMGAAYWIVNRIAKQTAKEVERAQASSKHSASSSRVIPAGGADRGPTSTT